MDREGKAKHMRLQRSSFHLLWLLHTKSVSVPSAPQPGWSLPADTLSWLGLLSSSPSWDPDQRCRGERHEGCQNWRLNFQELSKPGVSVLLACHGAKAQGEARSICAIARAPRRSAALASQAAEITPCLLLPMMIHAANWRQDGS